jgi:Carboxypeptidase regulatory-like domain
MRRALVLSLMLFALLSGAAFAQYAGTIQGVVTDPAGAVVAGAQVTAINTATNDTRTATTNGEGGYVLTAMPPGTYEVHVKQASFAEFVAKGVELHVSSTYDVNAQLKLAKAANEQVTVEANAIQVQTDNASLGTVIEGQQVTELPLNGRSFKQLALLEPGVAARDGLNVVQKGLLAGSDISVNGNPVTNNLWLVDGVNNNDLGSNRTLLIYPSIDAISEFKFVTNSYGPEYGQASGGIISIITKGGTNQFHGTGYYSGRNGALNSRNYFSQPGTKDPLQRNDYGYSVGGPIKKDKLFFFWSEEWNKEKEASVRSASCMPTGAELAGDFSANWNEWDTLHPGDLTDTPVDQCNATLPAVPGTRVTGNQHGTPLPTITTLDPAGVLMSDHLPLANILTGGQPNLTPNSGPNWSATLGTKLDWRQENARIDYNLNRKNTLTFRYTQENWSNPAPSTQSYWGDDPYPAVEASWSQPSKSVMLKDTTVLSSTLTNEAQLSYSNNRIYATQGGSGITTPDALGNTYTPSAFVTALEAAIPPAFTGAGLAKKAGGMPPDAAWGGFGSYGGGQTIWAIAPWNNTSDLYNFRDDLAKVQGQHTFKVGIFIGYNKKHEPSEGGHDQPSFSFNSGNNGAGPGNSGNALADLLTPGSQYGFGENSANLFPTAIWHQYEFYVQDSWKVRRNLTIDYGFRWSLLREPIEQHNRIASWELSQWSSAVATANPADACNGLIVVPGTSPCAAANALLGTNFSTGTPGVNNALVPNNNHAIAPRLGVSWDPWSDGKTAVRFGIGQFYQQERVSRVTNLMGQNAPFSVNFSSTRTLGVAVPAAGGNTAPNGATSPDSFIPNSWQWNFSIQRELVKDTTLQIGYVGNRGLHLTSDRDANGIPLNATQRLLEAFQGTAVCSSDPSCAGAVTRPAFNFGGIDQFGHAGASSYHALQVSATSKLGNHSTIQAAYTWSHTISNVDSGDSSGSGFGTHSQTDPYNINADRGNSTINRPQMFTANAIFYLPKFAGASTLEREALGGWEMGTIFYAESGNSLTNFYNGTVQDQNFCNFAGAPLNCATAFSNNISDTYGTANGAGNINAQRFMTTGVACNAGEKANQILNPAAFTLVGYTIGTIGNSPKGYCLGPKTVNLDLSAYKTWKVGERLSIQFRFDAFNALNHTQFASGNINTGGVTGVACGTTACSPTNNVVTATNGSFASNFGQATTERPESTRQLQYGLKFIF